MQPTACLTRKLKDDMSPQPGASGPHEEQPRRRDDLPPEILEIIIPALKIGGLSGASGALVGAFAGILSSSTPVMFALASSIQWSVLGSTFWASRGVVLHAWGKDAVSSRDKISASAIAGGVGGSAGGLLRGRKNVIPGAIMFAIFGAAGQAMYNIADARKSRLAENTVEVDLKDSWLNSKWSPMKVLSDAEYETMLQEKLLRINAQIALVDENIDALRAEERQIAARRAQDESRVSK